MRSRTLTAYAVLVVLTIATVSAEEINVDPNDPLQDVIDKAQPGDVIVLAPGVYAPPEELRVSDFNSPLTLRGRDGADATTITGANLRSILELEQRADLRIEGLSLVSGLGENGGGAIRVDFRASLTAVDCVFENCLGGNGGAIWVSNAARVDLLRCTLRGNTAEQRGGAIFLEAQAILAVAECVFELNDAEDAGGAIYAEQQSVIDIAASTLTLNTTQQSGGAIFIDDARSFRLTDSLLQNNSANQSGAVHADQGSVVVERSRFLNNTAQNDAGAMSLDLRTSQFPATAAISQCEFRGNTGGDVAALRAIVFEPNTLTVTSSLFADHASGDGAPPACRFDGIGPVSIVGCTFVDLESFETVLQVFNRDGIVANTIVRNSGKGQPALDINPRVTLRGSNVSSIDPKKGGDVIDADPMFVDPEAGDYRLMPGSPSIDTGIDALLLRDTADADGDGNVVEPIPLDLTSGPRSVDDPDAPGSATDMGAYERGGDCLTDYDGNGVVNAADVGAFLSDYFIEAVTGLCP